MAGIHDYLREAGSWWQWFIFNVLITSNHSSLDQDMTILHLHFIGIILIICAAIILSICAVSSRETYVTGLPVFKFFFSSVPQG